MAEIAIIAMVAKTALDATSAIAQGNYESKVATQKANLAERQGLSAQASSQRRMINEGLRKEKILSDNVASAASSGAGVGDVSVQGVQSRVEQEGSFRQLTALYEGNRISSGLKHKADSLRIEGKNARKAGNIKAAGIVLSGMAKAGGMGNDMYGSEPASSKFSSSYYGGGEDTNNFPWKTEGSVRNPYAY